MTQAKLFRLAKPARLSPGALDLVAARFRVLGEPLRLQLLVVLQSGERNVTQLVAATGGTQTNISRHLQTLTAAGILSRRKQGLSVFYTIADPTIFDLCHHVCGSLQKHIQRNSLAFRKSRGPRMPSDRAQHSP